ncbi:response regulator [Candidatus Thiodiazotropha sp. CDECU1]|uniref:response regulator n=1 Tax=Candidatus Thiodiazotropha sp. CDECU1 TaxID=3065865 RepID=UPI00292FED33|nr:response regulator [Candidatus Thiodiazotropha sp. CDECU1]
MSDSNDKKKILFVDDEPNVLSGLRRTLRTQRKVWEMEFVASGQDALAKAAESSFDAVVTDMRMPGMDGAELLNRIAKNHPDTIRVVLSGQSDQESVMKTVGPAHQYLNKPCEIDALKTTLARAFSLRDLLGESRLKSLVSGMRKLPSLPALYNELMIIIQDPNASVADVGRLVAKDPAMTVKILQLVNSAFFGLGRHISNPVDAASLLGLEILKPLVLSIGIFKQFEADKLDVKGFSLDALWLHSSRVGSLAKLIAKKEGMEASTVEDSLLAGMLHDIGKLILVVNQPTEYSQLMEMQLVTLDQRVTAEKQVFGTTHGVVGAYLLGLWGLPQSVVEAVALHNQPAAQGERVFSVLSVVHIANALMHVVDEGAVLDDLLDLDYTDSIKLADRIDSWKALTDSADFKSD